MALKVAPILEPTDDDDSSEVHLQDLAFFSKKLENYARRKGKFLRHKGGTSKRDFKREDQGKNFEICYEYGKNGHICSKCPHVKKKANRGSSRRNALAAWSDDDEDEDEEELEQGVANLCFMTTKENEVSSELSKDKLQEMFDELLIDFQNLFTKYEELSLVKSKIEKSSHTMETKLDKALNENKVLKNEIEKFKAIDFENLKNENESLKSKVSTLTKDLANFIKGEKNLKMLLGKQKCMFDKNRIGFDKNNNVKLYKNFFVKKSTTYIVTCIYYQKPNHVCYKCKSKKPQSNMVLIPKGMVVANANTKRPKQVWVPKKK